MQQMKNIIFLVCSKSFSKGLFDCAQMGCLQTVTEK